MRLVVLYGSQTGTAQDVAEQIWRESRSYGCTGPVLPLDEYPLERLLEEPRLVFVVATTGVGEEPDNMRQTWRFLLRRNLPTQLLQHLSYAVLALGDSSYAQFNYAGKKLNRRLQQLGATPLLAPGLCDDQHDHGLSAVSLPWIADLWRQLGLQTAEQAANPAIFKFQVTQLPVAALSTPAAELSRRQWPLKPPPVRFRLRETRRTTTPTHFQDVRLLSFDFPAGISWQPGDVLQVRPCNSAEQIKDFFELLAEHNLPFGADTVLHFAVAHAEMPLPAAYEQPVTLRELVTSVWDLNALPRQRAFELLALNCPDELEQEKLREFATSAGIEDLIAYVQRPRRSTLEVLQDFRHATAALTLPVLCELFPFIQARSYSIASHVATGSLDLLVAVVEYKTKLSKPRLGLCSIWLKSLREGEAIWGLIKTGSLKIPVAPELPLILVGPGTGIAPFRSIIQSRVGVEKQAVLVVFFGCRNRAKDFYFEQDFKRWQADGLVDLHVAFSRDQEQKIYVQHLIEQESEKLRALIQLHNAVVLVAGASNSMPKAVREAFTLDVLNGDKAYVDKMLKTKRYQEETWS